VESLPIPRLGSEPYRSDTPPLAVVRVRRAGPRDAVELADLYRINERALAFYRRQGFVAVGTHPYHFGGEVHDDIVMVRERSRAGE
jgi:ribosomal protein S18 acetylase RimI-like enzyme